MTTVIFYLHTFVKAGYRLPPEEYACKGECRPSERKERMNDND